MGDLNKNSLLDFKKYLPMFWSEFIYYILSNIKSNIWLQIKRL